jgi:hypothetical protein
MKQIQESEQPWIRSMDFASFYSFSNGLWNCSNYDFFFIFGEAIHTNFIVIGMTLPVVKPTICRSRGENNKHKATDAVCNLCLNIELEVFRCFLYEPES